MLGRADHMAATWQHDLYVHTIYLDQGTIRPERHRSSDLSDVWNNAGATAWIELAPQAEKRTILPDTNAGGYFWTKLAIVVPEYEHENSLTLPSTLPPPNGTLLSSPTKAFSRLYLS